MTNNILIADSGSTKTHWALIANDGNVQHISTAGINPLYQEASEISSMLSTSDIEWGSIEHIYFYGAGCIGGKANETITTALQSIAPQAIITIQSDLMAACHALLGNRAGIACILGTGANSCCFDGEKIVANTPPLGFILGDEGSGAYIGKRLLSDALKGILPTDISQKLMQWIGIGYAEIINKVYKQPYPNRFLASLTHFAADNIDRDEIHNIVLEAFVTFIDRNLMRYDADMLAQPINFVGSVAFNFEYILAEAIEMCGLQIGNVEQNPIDGLINRQLQLMQK